MSRHHHTMRSTLPQKKGDGGSIILRMVNKKCSAKSARHYDPAPLHSRGARAVPGAEAEPAPPQRARAPDWTLPDDRQQDCRVYG